jgi:hypothetical protein
MEAIEEKMAALNVSPKPKASKPKKNKKNKETNEKKKSQMPIPKSVTVQSKLNIATPDAGENQKGGNSD